MNQKGLVNILVIVGLIIFVVVFSYFFLVSPHKVAGRPIKPFKEGEFILSEKITYLFRKPEVGDRVIFLPATQGIDYLGIIVDTEEKADIKTYKIVSGEKGTIWIVSAEKITSRIYYPFVSKQEIDSSLSSVPQPTILPTPSNTDEIANWKTFSDKMLSFRYPSDWQVDKPGIFGSRSEINFEYKKVATFTLSEIGNYNQVAGRPYVSLDEYISLKKEQAKDITIADNSGKLITNPGDPGHSIPFQEALFFTQDRSFIVSLYYQKDYYDQPSSTKILDQILPTFKFLEAEGKFCGGIAGNLPENQCPTGYKCQLDGNYPDAGGKCVKI